jgi:predicted DNA-binding protein with PD1-like motif
MEYRKIGDNYYIRMDRGDEIVSNLLEICEKESIPSAVFSGIGGCQSAELQVFIPETGSFETEQLEGMLELVSLNGNVVRDDDGKLFHHTHALFSFKGGDRNVNNIVGGNQDGQEGLRATLLPSGGRMAGGHLKATTVLYTAEIELRPTVGGAIGRKFDPETGTGFWAFKD